MCLKSPLHDNRKPLLEHMFSIQGHNGSAFLVLETYTKMASTIQGKTLCLLHYVYVEMRGEKTTGGAYWCISVWSYTRVRCFNLNLV
jgi:hypothetical protein